jgi:hypothetical protein
MACLKVISHKAYRYLPRRWRRQHMLGLSYLFLRVWPVCGYYVVGASRACVGRLRFFNYSLQKFLKFMIYSYFLGPPQ